MKKWIQRSFRRELFSCFLLVAVLPLVVGCFFFIHMFQKKMDSDLRQKDKELSEAVEARLSEVFDGFRETADILSQDETMGIVLRDGMGGSRNEGYRRLYEVTEELRDLAKFEIYTAEGLCLYSTGTGIYKRTLPAYWGILRASLAHPEELVVRRETENSGEQYLRFCRAFMGEEDECRGFLVITMDEENFETALSGAFGGQDGICILDSFLETVYSAGTASGQRFGTALRERFLSGKSMTDIFEDNRVYMEKIGETGLFMVLLRPDFFTKDTTSSMYAALGLMAAASFCLCLFVAIGMSGHLSRPIQVLSGAMDKVQEGNMDTRVKIGRTDEFGELADNFNIMTQRISCYMEERVERQRQLNETQIAMMQAQLNPHFLYNTLDTMKWVAKANHIPEIATLAAKLAKILRTSISSAQFIPLREEMDLVECYAEIQKIRFHGKFGFSCDMEEELSEVLVPKLVIQPIVENSVIHGLADCDEGQIAVRAFQGEKGKMVITVEDNGCGISEEVLGYLNSGNREALKGHLGFFNADTIIRLHYGAEYGLQVMRPESGGTRVIIVLPCEPVLLEN